jgi:hypothetical protein
MLIVGKELAPSLDVMDPLSMRHRWFTCVRLSYPCMTGLIPPLDRNVHHLTISSSAAYGCLKPTPASRLRRAYLHLEYSTVFKHQTRSWHKVPGRELHPLESSAFHGALFRQQIGQVPVRHESKAVAVSFSVTAHRVCAVLLMGVHAIILGLALRNRLRLLRHNIANRRNRYTSPAFSEIKKGILDTDARNSLFSTAEIC